MLRDVLGDAKSKYELPDDDVVSLVLNPALAESVSFDCMSGYFNAQALADLAHGLARYIHNSDQPFRLLISPSLSGADQAALENSENLEADVFQMLGNMLNASVDAAERALSDHARDCLSYLLKHRRLELRIVVLKGGGIFHPKLWLFDDGIDKASFEGSCNITHAGLNHNVERMTLQTSWANLHDVERDFEYFGEFWNNTKSNSVTISASQARLLDLFKEQQTVTPTEDDYWKALGQSPDSAAMEPDSKFAIPPSVNWAEGDFSHQLRAVTAWEENARHGILEMATGAGKTITSLICAKRLHEDVGSLLIVIAAPTLVLTNQWIGDCGFFGLSPYLCDSGKLHSQHITKIQRKINSLELGITSVEVVVMTHELAKNQDLSYVLSKAEIPVLFVGDEVHRLGLSSFLETPPKIPYVLGLSATPNRKFDDEGNKGLREYFGKVVFSFGIEEAIGICLVPYNYYPAVVQLTDQEFETWQEWQLKIAKFLSACPDKLSRQQQKQLTVLARNQRAIIESSVAKIPKLREQLLDKGLSNLMHTLIYCTSAKAQQMDDVNGLLNTLDISFHRVTQDETPNKKLMREILSRFDSGENKVLTAKKVLDEGFNVPQIATAFILASTTSEREWVQRRGRVLRKSPGKTSADLYDYLVLPPTGALDETETLNFARADLARLWEFGRISLNKQGELGIDPLIEKLRTQFQMLVWPPVLQNFDEIDDSEDLGDLEVEIAQGNEN